MTGLPYRRFGRYRSERLSFLAAGGRACRSAAPLPCFGRATVFHPEIGFVRVFRRDIEIGVAFYAGKEVCTLPLPSLLFLKGNGYGKSESDACPDSPQASFYTYMSTVLEPGLKRTLLPFQTNVPPRWPGSSTRPRMRLPSRSSSTAMRPCGCGTVPRSRFRRPGCGAMRTEAKPGAEGSMPHTVASRS